jgi:hypothetical protein
MQLCTETSNFDWETISTAVIYIAETPNLLNLSEGGRVDTSKAR